MSDNAKMVLAFVISTALMVPLAVGSGYYLDSVLGPVLRGTAWEFLAFGSVATIVGGSGWAWWKIHSWVYDSLGGR